MFCDTFLLVVDTGNNITNHTIRGQAFAWPLIVIPMSMTMGTTECGQAKPIVGSSPFIVGAVSSIFMA